MEAESQTFQAPAPSRRKRPSLRHQGILFFLASLLHFDISASSSIVDFLLNPKFGSKWFIPLRSNFTLSVFNLDCLLQLNKILCADIVLFLIQSSNSLFFPEISHFRVLKRNYKDLSKMVSLIPRRKHLITFWVS